jgi:predicted oxidoreductase
LRKLGILKLKDFFDFLGSIGVGKNGISLSSSTARGLSSTKKRAGSFPIAASTILAASESRGGNELALCPSLARK